jgi:hypothetical protein
MGFSCKKDSQDNVTTSTETTDTTKAEDTAKSDATELFVNTSMWAYGNTDDIGKQVKTNKLMEFGNKVSVIGDKKVGDVEYKQIVLPDKSKYWIEDKYLSEKFITINQPDVTCYKQPDESFANKSVKLQNGDYLKYLGEQDGFIKVTPISSLPRGKNSAVVWIGEVWIKDGYTEDLATAKDSYKLALAYYQLYDKKDKAKAIEMMKQMIEDGVEGDLGSIIQNIVSQLEAGN